MKVLSEYMRSASFCIQHVQDLLGVSGRIGVAVRNR